MSAIDPAQAAAALASHEQTLTQIFTRLERDEQT